MKFLVPNYSCLQNPWLRGYHPQIPVLSVLCPQLNLLNPPGKKFLGTPLGGTKSLCEPFGEDKNLFGPQGFESLNVPHTADNQVPLIRYGINTLLTMQASVVFVKYKCLCDVWELTLMLWNYNAARGSRRRLRKIGTWAAKVAIYVLLKEAVGY